MPRWMFIGWIFFWCSAAFAQDGLVAYYPFNGNADDESGHSIHGTVNGPVLTTDRLGEADSAYLFDGVDDNIVARHDTVLHITERLSLAAWVYPTAQKTQFIIRKGSEYYLALSGTGDVVFTIEPEGQFTQARKTGYTLDAWMFVVGTYDGSTMNLYVNGQLEASESITGALPVTTSPLQIGTRTRMAADTFEGKLDDLRVFNAALSESDVQSLYSDVATSTQEQASELPDRPVLDQNYPNPFNPATVISYHLAEASTVALTVYTVSGRVVKTLVRENQPAGMHQIRWDGRTEAGRPVAGGVYLYRLTAGASTVSRMMVLLR